MRRHDTYKLCCTPELGDKPFGETNYPPTLLTWRIGTSLSEHGRPETPHMRSRTKRQTIWMP
jgi:hypothetical protein